MCDLGPVPLLLPNYPCLGNGRFVSLCAAVTEEHEALGSRITIICAPGQPIPCMLDNVRVQAGLKITLHGGEVANENEVDAMLAFSPDRFGHMCTVTEKQAQILLV
jgi:hypothetical protein